MSNDGEANVVEVGLLTERDWADLASDEREPFGPIGSGLEWRDKDRYLGVRAPDGRLIAVAGAAIATVDVEGAGSFEVVGLGGLIVTRPARGGGLMSKLVGPMLEIAEGMGPELAMIFCRPELVALYRRLAFTEIPAAVWVDQPEGRIEMPVPAMWRALHEGAEWPAGRVDLRGLPF